jgi:non-ribosomal peptide synthetase component F
VKHESFMNFTYSLVHINALGNNDIMVQLSTSTFDAHVLEILGSLISGATVIMLHPNGNIDFGYFYQTLHDKHVTHIQGVPSFLNHLCEFIEKKAFDPWTSMRNICCVGE